MARAAEAILRQGPPWEQTERLVEGTVAILNDYVGYRPMAVLETRPNTDYYPHEKVRPVPVYLKNASVAPGKYADLLRPALDLLTNTEPILLEEACFDPAKLDELAFDPRCSHGSRRVRTPWAAPANGSSKPPPYSLAPFSWERASAAPGRTITIRT
jgi:hypothetical protein